MIYQGKQVPDSGIAVNETNVAVYGKTSCDGCGGRVAMSDVRPQDLIDLLVGKYFRTAITLCNGCAQRTADLLQARVDANRNAGGVIELPYANYGEMAEARRENKQ